MKNKQTIFYYEFIFNIGFGFIKDFYPASMFSRNIRQWTILLPFVRIYWSDVELTADDIQRR